MGESVLETCQLADQPEATINYIGNKIHLGQNLENPGEIKENSFLTIKKRNSNDRIENGPKNPKKINFEPTTISTTDKYLQVLLIILILKLPGEGVTNAEIVRLKK